MDCWCVCDWISTSRLRLHGFEGEGGGLLCTRHAWTCSSLTVPGMCWDGLRWSVVGLVGVCW